MTTLEDYCTGEVRALERADRRRMLKESAREGCHVVQNNQRYISFSCNDYLGLSNDPRVIAAASAAVKQYGNGSGASRLVTGNHPLYAKLEAQIARMKHREAAVVFGSGYMANIGTIPVLVGKGDVIFADKLVHACLLDGAQLSGATIKRFRHNDTAHLAALMAQHRSAFKHALVLVDHVYSMDGDVAPLAELSALCHLHKGWLMADDAHGLGILPHSNNDAVDIWMGTLSKSAGSYGGYVAASRAVVDMLVTKARSLVFSTGLPPATCAGALAALEIMEVEPERGKRALALANRVADALGMPHTSSPILPLILGSETRALALSEQLKQRGILAAAIRPPTVPPGTARLRLTFSAGHTDAEVDMLIASLQAKSGLV